MVLLIPSVHPVFSPLCMVANNLFGFDLGSRCSLTCQVQIVIADYSMINARAMLDSASSTSFIIESLPHHLYL